MEKLKQLWGVIVIGFVLSIWGVKGHEFDEFFSNKSKVTFLESIYGASAASVPPNALMVGLTLVQGAAAKGAGNFSFLQLAF